MFLQVLPNSLVAPLSHFSITARYTLIIFTSSVVFNFLAPFSELFPLFSLTIRFSWEDNNGIPFGDKSPRKYRYFIPLFGSSTLAALSLCLQGRGRHLPAVIWSLLYSSTPFPEIIFPSERSSRLGPLPAILVGLPYFSPVLGTWLGLFRSQKARAGAPDRLLMGFLYLPPSFLGFRWSCQSKKPPPFKGEWSLRDPPFSFFFTPPPLLNPLLRGPLRAFDVFFSCGARSYQPSLTFPVHASVPTCFRYTVDSAAIPTPFSLPF